MPKNTHPPTPPLLPVTNIMDAMRKARKQISNEELDDAMRGRPRPTAPNGGVTVDPGPVKVPKK